MTDVGDALIPGISRLIVDLAKYWNLPVESRDFVGRVASVRQKFPGNIFDAVEERTFRQLVKDIHVSAWLLCPEDAPDFIARLTSRDRILSLLDAAKFKEAEQAYLKCSSLWSTKDYARLTHAKKVELQRICQQKQEEEDANRFREASRQARAYEISQQAAMEASRLEDERVLGRTEFITTLRAMMHSKQQGDAKNINEFILAQKVPYFVHFTRIENLSAILDHGIIPRASLVSGFVHNDDQRHDGFLEASSLSTSFPNYQMFYRYQCQDRGANWVVIAVSTEALLTLPCLFYPSNAASNRFRNESKQILSCRMGLEGLASMFADEPAGLRRKLSIPPSYTTDPQAEVLVFGTIDPSYFTAIGLMHNDANARQLVRTKLPSIRFEVGGRMFKPREDYQFWSESLNSKSFISE